MKIIDQSYEFIQKPILPLELIEKAGRTCYQSWDRIQPDSAEKFAKMVLSRGHESVIEHVSATIKLITNRGVMAELTRHRLCSFSIESTRYIRYDNIEFIKPVWWDDTDTRAKARFKSSCQESEDSYRYLIESCKWRPEQAREVLPNALKTEIVMTANVREWRHVFKLRTSKKAHPQIRALMLNVLAGFKKEIPVLFEKIKEEKGDVE